MTRWFASPIPKKLIGLIKRGALTKEKCYAAELECAVERAEEGSPESARWVLSQASLWLANGEPQQFTAHPAVSRFLSHALREIACDSTPADKALRLKIRANKRPLGKEPTDVYWHLVKEWGTGKPFKSSNKGAGLYDLVGEKTGCSLYTVKRIHRRWKQETKRLNAALLRQAMRLQDPPD